MVATMTQSDAIDTYEDVKSAALAKASDAFREQARELGRRIEQRVRTEELPIDTTAEHRDQQSFRLLSTLALLLSERDQQFFTDMNNAMTEHGISMIDRMSPNDKAK